MPGTTKDNWRFSVLIVCLTSSSKLCVVEFKCDLLPLQKYKDQLKIVWAFAYPRISYNHHIVLCWTCLQGIFIHRNKIKTAAIGKKPEGHYRKTLCHTWLACGWITLQPHISHQRFKIPPTQPLLCSPASMSRAWGAKTHLHTKPASLSTISPTAALTEVNN